MLDKHGRLRDLSGLVADFAGNTVSLAALAELAARDLESAPVVAGLERLGPPFGMGAEFLLYRVELCRPCRRDGCGQARRAFGVFQGHIVAGGARG